MIQNNIRAIFLQQLMEALGKYLLRGFDKLVRLVIESYFDHVVGFAEYGTQFVTVCKGGPT